MNLLLKHPMFLIMSLTVLVNGTVMVIFPENDRSKTKVKECKHKTTTKEEKEKTKKEAIVKPPSRTPAREKK